MGLFDSVKGKIGKNEENNDQQYYDDSQDNADDLQNQGYDDYSNGFQERNENDEFAGDIGSQVSFDAYNPDKFENIVISGGNKKLRPATYDDVRDSNFGRGRSIGRPYAHRQTSYGTSARTHDNYMDTVIEEPDFVSDPRRSTSLHESIANARLDSKIGQYQSNLTEQHINSAGQYKRTSSLKNNDGLSSGIEVIQPRAYGEVKNIANAFKADKSVVIVLSGCPGSLAKRILDFSFGVACALDGTVEKKRNSAYVMTKPDVILSDSDIESLANQGIVL